MCRVLCDTILARLARILIPLRNFANADNIMPALIALLVFFFVALAAFAAGSLIDQRNARARLIKDRLATVQKAPERDPNEELALLRDEQLSQIPAFDTLLRRSARVSASYAWSAVSSPPLPPPSIPGMPPSPRPR